jgi:hypothetical protein
METKKQEKTTLSTFIEKNQAIINVFGVFAAVTAYFAQIKGDDFCSLLYLFFLVMTVILSLELSEKFLEIPEDGMGLKQILFMYMFLAGFALMFTYIFPEIKKMTHSLGVFIVWEVLLVLSILIVGKMGLIKRFLRWKEWVRLFGILILIMLLSMLFGAAEHIATWLSTVPYLNIVFK